MYFNIRHTATKKKEHLWPSVTSAKRCAFRILAWFVGGPRVPERVPKEKKVTKVVKP